MRSTKKIDDGGDVGYNGDMPKKTSGKNTSKGSRHPKFIQLAILSNEAIGYVYALDEDGCVWELNALDDADAWTPVTSARKPR
jgi:hypothetical protein